MISLVRRLLSVTLKVDHDDWFVSDNPPIVPWGNQGDIASLDVSFCAIIHDHMQCSRYLVLEMRSFTALRLYDRLDVSGPPPSRLEHSSPDRRFADLHKLKFSPLKRSCLVRSIRTLNFQFTQCSSNQVHHRLPRCKKLPLYKATERISSMRGRGLTGGSSPDVWRCQEQERSDLVFGPLVWVS